MPREKNGGSQVRGPWSKANRAPLEISVESLSCDSFTAALGWGTPQFDRGYEDLFSDAGRDLKAAAASISSVKAKHAFSMAASSANPLESSNQARRRLAELSE